MQNYLSSREASGEKENILMTYYSQMFAVTTSKHKTMAAKVELKMPPWMSAMPWKERKIAPYESGWQGKVVKTLSTLRKLTQAWMLWLKYVLLPTLPAAVHWLASLTPGPPAPSWSARLCDALGPKNAHQLTDKLEVSHTAEDIWCTIITDHLCNSIFKFILLHVPVSSSNKNELGSSSDTVSRFHCWIHAVPVCFLKLEGACANRHALSVIHRLRISTSHSPSSKKIPLMIQNPMSVSGRNPMFIQRYDLMKSTHQLRHEYFTVTQLPPCSKSLEKVERHGSKRCLGKPQLGHCFASRTELS